VLYFLETNARRKAYANGNKNYGKNADWFPVHSEIPSTNETANFQTGTIASIGKQNIDTFNGCTLFLFYRKRQKELYKQP
jgi:hypothetical protein